MDKSTLIIIIPAAAILFFAANIQQDVNFILIRRGWSLEKEGGVRQEIKSNKHYGISNKFIMLAIMASLAALVFSYFNIILATYLSFVAFGILLFVAVGYRFFGFIELYNAKIDNKRVKSKRSGR